MQGLKKNDKTVGYAFHLLDPWSLLEMARVMQEGEDLGKPRGGWRKLSSEEQVNRAIGHLLAYLGGDSQDDHLSHAMVRTSMAWSMQKEEERKGISSEPATDAAPHERCRPYYVYVCYPYAGRPKENTVRATKWAKALDGLSMFPSEALFIVPHLVMAYHGEETPRNRERIMGQCLELVKMCDEVAVCGPHVSPGMLAEISYAEFLGKLVSKFPGEDPS